MKEFLVKFPIWIQVTKDSFVTGPLPFTKVLGDHPDINTGTHDGRRFVPVFTDEDLAERHLAKMDSRWANYCFTTREQAIRWFKEFQSKGITHVIFDMEPVGTLWSIDSILRSWDDEGE
ncbi:MAG TPA: hypothetical protein VGJ05_14200 [Fimbriiglobus sp.]|jgi:hypothetical protein